MPPIARTEGYLPLGGQANRRIRQALDSAKVMAARQKPQRVGLSIILGGVVLTGLFPPFTGSPLEGPSSDLLCKEPLDPRGQVDGVLGCRRVCGPPVRSDLEH